MKIQAVCKHCGIEITTSDRRRLWMHSITNVGERRYEYKYCMLSSAEPGGTGVHSVSVESPKTDPDRCVPKETLP